MSKGLEALENIKYCQTVNGIDDDGKYKLGYLHKVMKGTFNTIEYELKAFEIIKVKKVNIFLGNPDGIRGHIFCLKLHDCFHSFRCGGPGNQLKADKAGVAAGFQTGKYVGIIDLAGAGFVTARSVSNVDVAELVCVGADVVTDASLIELHMVNIVQDLQIGAADQSGHFRGHTGGPEKIARMIGCGIQRLQVYPDTALPGNSGARQQRFIHGAQLYRVGQFLIMVEDHTAGAKAVGVDGQAPGTHLYGGLHRLLQEIQISRFLPGVDE